MSLKLRVRQLKQDIPALFLALKKRETPWYAKALAALTVGYALSPIDLIPDFIPILGYVDDLIILPFLIAATLRLIPKSVLDTCRAEAAEMWQGGKPKKWYYAMPIVVLWLVVVGLIIRAIM